MRQPLHLLPIAAAGLSSQLAYALQDSYQNDNLGLEEFMFSDYVSPTGRQLQDGETLGQYEIGPSTLFYFGTSINLDFTLNALVEEETVAIKLYSDSDCTQDITDSDYLVPELIFDQDFVQNSTSVRPMRVQLTINEGQIKTSPVWQERDDQFFIFFCTKVSLYTGNVTDPGAVEISILETLSQIKVDLVGGFGVDVNVSPNNATAEEANQVYFVEGFLCDDTLQKVTYDRPRTQGSTLRVCVKPTDAALADGLKMRAVDSFSFYRDQVGSVQITQEALARGESANPSLTTLICVRGTELCYFDTLLKAEFFYGAGNVQGFGEAWLQFGSGEYRRLEIRSRSLQAEPPGRVESGFAGASSFDINFFVIPTGEDGQSLYEAEVYECDRTNQEIISLAPRTDGASIRICIRPNEIARGLGIKINKIVSWNFTRTDLNLIQWAVEPEIQATDGSVEPEIQATDGLTTLMCLPGSEVCAFRTQLMSNFFDIEGIISGVGSVWLEFASTGVTSINRRRAEEVPLNFAGASPLYLDTSVIYQEPYIAACEYEHIFTEWWIEEDINDRYMYIGILAGTAATIACLLLACAVCPCFRRRGDKNDEDQDVQVNVDVKSDKKQENVSSTTQNNEESKSTISGATDHSTVSASKTEDEEMGLGSSRKKRKSSRSALVLPTGDVQEDYTPATGDVKENNTPDRDDVCFEEDDHPGTKHFIRVVRKVIMEDPDAKYSPATFKSIKRGLKGRRLYKMTTKGRYREVSSDKLIDLCGVAFKEQKYAQEDYTPDAGDVCFDEEDDAQEDYTPDSDDVCFDEEDHPGTAHFIRVIRSIIMEDPDAKYSFTTFKSIKKSLKGRRFYKMTKKGRYREVSNDKLIDLWGFAFKEQKRTYSYWYKTKWYKMKPGSRELAKSMGREISKLSSRELAKSSSRELAKSSSRELLTRSSSRELALLSSSKHDGEKGVLVRRSGSHKSLNDDDSSSKKKSRRRSLRDHDDEDKQIRRSGSRTSLRDDDSSNKKKKSRRRSLRDDDDDDDDKEIRRSGSRKSLRDDDSSSKKKGRRKSLRDHDDDDKEIRRSGSRKSLRDDDSSSKKKSRRKSLRDDDDDKDIRRSSSRKSLRDDDSSSKKKGRRKSLRDADDDKEIRRSSSRKSLRSDGGSSNRKLERKSSRQSLHEEETKKARRMGLNDID